MGSNPSQFISALTETESPVRNRKGQGGVTRRLAAPFAAVAALFMLCGQSSPLESAMEASSREARGGGIGPVADWIDDVIGDLTDGVDDAEDASSLVGGNLGPLPIINRLLLSDTLDDIEERIDRILDPNQYPSLTPADAGEIDPSYAPTLLSGVAADVLELSEAALDELHSGTPDHEIIGTKLRTTKSLLDEYRLLAGINLSLIVSAE